MLIKLLFVLSLLYQFIVSPILTLLTIKSNQSEGFLIAHVGLQPDNWKSMKEIENVSNTIKIIGIKHKSALLRLDYSDWNEWFNTPTLFYCFLNFTKGLLGIFILYNLLCIFRQLKEHKVFSPSNVDRVHYISFTLLAIPIVELLSVIIKFIPLNRLKLQAIKLCRIL